MRHSNVSCGGFSYGPKPRNPHPKPRPFASHPPPPPSPQKCPAAASATAPSLRTTSPARRCRRRASGPPTSTAASCSAWWVRGPGGLQITSRARGKTGWRPRPALAVGLHAARRCCGTLHGCDRALAGLPARHHNSSHGPAPRQSNPRSTRAAPARFAIQAPDDVEGTFTQKLRWTMGALQV